MQFDQNTHPTVTPSQWKILVQAAQDKERLAQLFNEHRDRLKRIVGSSIDHRLNSRMDASDVLQETYMEAFSRIHEYLAKPNVSLFVWLRFLAKQRLSIMHRQNLHVQSRDARRELSLESIEDTRRSKVALAAQLAGRLTTASASFSRKELKLEIQSALDRLDAKSREVLLLRHFEQLSNVESAEVLQISTTAACNRYIRALERLKGMLNLSLGTDP